MGIIKDRFREKADAISADIKGILKEHGDKVIGEVTLSQIYAGMRGITALVSETSLLDAQDGIRFRGYSIPELREKLAIPVPFRKLKEYAEDKVKRPSDGDIEWKRDWSLSKLRISNNLMILCENITKILKYYIINCIK